MTGKPKTTEQDSVTPPQKRNPTGKGGFGDNPENRNPGGWKKEDSISYQYNKLMRLPWAEFLAFKPETAAQKIAFKRITMAITSEGLHDTKEITDRTEGKAPQSIDVTTNGDSVNAYSSLTADELRKLAGK